MASLLMLSLAHTCACDQHRRVGKATTSPIAGNVLAASSVALVLAPSPEAARFAEQPAGGQAAESFRGAFERGVGIAAADPHSSFLRYTNTRLMWVNHTREAEPYGCREAEPVGPNVSTHKKCPLCKFPLSSVLKSSTHARTGARASLVMNQMSWHESIDVSQLMPLSCY